MSRLTRLWLAGFVALLTGGFMPAPEAAPRSQVEEVARVPIYWPPGVDSTGLSGNGVMVINARARRGYQIFRMANSKTFVQAVDLDTLKRAASATYDVLPSPGSVGAAFGEFIHTVDEDHNRLYLAYQSGGTLSGIIEIDGTSLKPLRLMDRNAAFSPDVTGTQCTAVSCVPTPPGINPSIRGMSFVPAITSPASRDKLLLLLQDSTSGASGAQSLIWMAQWDVQTARQDWIYRVQACSSRRLPDDPLSRYQLAVFQSPNGPYIYLACYAPGGTGQAVRLDQDGTSRPLAETGFPGPLGLVDALGDRESDRLLLKIVNEEGESYWVFDGQSSSYVGIIGTTLGPVSSSAGVDEVSGRLYVLGAPSVNSTRSDPGGLFLADARRSPAPQAIVFPNFSPPTGSVYRIGVDPAAGDRPTRLFMRYSGEDAYRVVRDAVDVSIDPPVADQDRFTTDTQEIAGVTESNFTGTAHAYGLRSVFVGGIEGVSPSRGTLLILGSPCQRPDREVVLARVRRAGVSNSLASATSIASDAEAITRADIQEPANRCYPRALPVVSGFDALSQERVAPLLKQADQASGRQWPFAESECAGDAESRHAAESVPGFTSIATCKQATQEVVASGIGDGFTGTGGVSVGQAYASVRLLREDGKGLAVRSEAWVRDIEVPGVFSIDVARTVAVARAAGRIGTAATSFDRRICGVRIAKEAIQAQQDLFFEGCYDPFSQTPVGTQPALNNQVTDRPLVFLLNRALGSRGRVRVPDPDAELAKGTPGGYLASVQKNRGEEIQARAISNDASTEVPAFEVIFFNDDQFAGRGRQLYQFAGVDASSTYGIFVPPTFVLGNGDLGEDRPPASLPELLVEMTGGMPELEPTVAVKGVQVLPPGNAVAAVVNRVAGGLKFLARTPREAILASLVWLLLGLPVYLAARRRALLTSQ